MPCISNRKIKCTTFCTFSSAQNHSHLSPLSPLVGHHWTSTTPTASPLYFNFTAKLKCNFLSIYTMPPKLFPLPTLEKDFPQTFPNSSHYTTAFLPTAKSRTTSTKATTPQVLLNRNRITMETGSDWVHRKGANNVEPKERAEWLGK